MHNNSLMGQSKVLTFQPNQNTKFFYILEYLPIEKYTKNIIEK